MKLLILFTIALTYFSGLFIIKLVDNVLHAKFGMEEILKVFVFYVISDRLTNLAIVFGASLKGKFTGFIQFVFKLTSISSRTCLA